MEDLNNFLTNSEENDSHLEAVIKNKPKENQIINITEVSVNKLFLNLNIILTL